MRTRRMLHAAFAAGYVALACAPASARALPRALGACQQALDTWQLGDARHACAQALFAQPDDATTRMAAAQTLHQLGRFSAARTLLHSLRPEPNALSTRVPRTTLDAAGQAHYEMLLPRIDAAARITAAMQPLRSEHFVQWAHDKDVIVAEYAVPVLERAYAALQQMLAFAPCADGEKIHVVWQPEPRALAASTGLTPANIETSGTIAVCKFHQLMVLSPAATTAGYDWADTLAHELTHLFVAKKTRDNTPVWLHEGLAKFYQSLWRGRAGLALDRSAMAELQQAQANKALIPLSRMHPSMAKLPSQKAAALAFTEVTTLVADVHRTHGPQAIVALLEALRRGQALEEALQRHWSTSLSGLSERLQILGRSPKLLEALAQKGEADEMPIALSAPSAEASHELTSARLVGVGDDAIVRAARLAELLELQDHAAAALPYLRQACAKAHHRYVALDVRLSRLLRQLDDASGARALMAACEAQHPNAQEVKLELGLAAAQMQAWPLAIDKLLASMQRNPFVLRAHEALAAGYAAVGEDYKAARERDFAAMCRRPRAQPDKSEPQALGSVIDIVTADWEPRLLDDYRIETPAWRVPITPGTHTVAPAPGAGGEATIVQVQPGTETLVLVGSAQERTP